MDAAEEVDAAVSKELKRRHQEEGEVLKLLLLGAGDSGKTTIFKQFRILYGEGYSEDKRAALRVAVTNNLVIGAQAVVKASLDGVAGRPLQGEAKRLGEMLLGLPENPPMSEEITSAVASLWEDSDFQATWEGRSNYQVLDGWEDFAKQCKNWPEWGGRGWIPSVADAIRARVRTSGIVEEQFVIDGLNFVLIDVGGQRNERRKWIHCFNEVTAVIFVAAISEYDQTLFEARDKNRLEETLELFDEISNSEYFTNTNLVLFLNKSDIFQQKYCERKIPINKSGLFPDAPGDFVYESGIDWMYKTFMLRNKNTSKAIFTHVTNATDTGNVQVVFDACKDSILKDSLTSLGLMMR